MKLSIQLSNAMFCELEREARIAGCSPAQFATETVDSAIAARRLERLPVSMRQTYPAPRTLPEYHVETVPEVRAALADSPVDEMRSPISRGY